MQSEAVSPPPITTTCLPPAQDRLVRRRRLAADAAVLLDEIGHGEMHAVEIAAREGRIARLLGAAGQQHRVVTRSSSAANGSCRRRH